MTSPGDQVGYGDPCAFFQFCKREISPDVTLLHDYPLYEWTMLVRHRRAPPADDVSRTGDGS